MRTINIILAVILSFSVTAFSTDSVINDNYKVTEALEISISGNKIFLNSEFVVEMEIDSKESTIVINPLLERLENIRKISPGTKLKLSAEPDTQYGVIRRVIYTCSEAYFYNIWLISNDSDTNGTIYEIQVSDFGNGLIENEDTLNEIWDFDSSNMHLSIILEEEKLRFGMFGYIVPIIAKDDKFDELSKKITQIKSDFEDDDNKLNRVTIFALPKVTYADLIRTIEVVSASEIEINEINLAYMNNFYALGLSTDPTINITIPFTTKSEYINFSGPGSDSLGFDASYMNAICVSGGINSADEYFERSTLTLRGIKYLKPGHVIISVDIDVGGQAISGKIIENTIGSDELASSILDIHTSSRWGYGEVSEEFTYSYKFTLIPIE